MTKKVKDLVLDVPVSFGGVSFGKKTARLSASVVRGELSVGAADKTLCDRRLVGTIKASASGDQEGQGRLEGMEDDIEMQVIADVKGLGLHSEEIKFGMTVNLKGLDRNTFSNFAAREGRLIVESTEEIPEDEKASSEHEEE